MNNKIKRDLLSVLEDACSALRHNKTKVLRVISDHTLHNANIYQDGDSIGIAITMYALSKIYERPNYREYKDWKVFDRNVRSKIVQAKNELKKGNIDGFRSRLAEINVVIEKLDQKLKKYIKETIYQAHISKGSRFYEHGLSIGKTADLLGISHWELMEYVGKTGIHDSGFNVTKSPQQRLKETRKMFS
jgi:hypothetical protein